MTKYTAAFTGLFILGVGTGALLGLTLPALFRRRRERDQARRQLQCEAASLRRDLDALRGDIGRLFARQTPGS